VLELRLKIGVEHDSAEEPSDDDVPAIGIRYQDGVVRVNRPKNFAKKKQHQHDLAADDEQDVA